VQGGADLVEAHEPRVARYVSGDYGCQPASDPAWMRFGHGHAIPFAVALCTMELSGAMDIMRPPAKADAHAPQMTLWSPLGAVWVGRYPGSRRSRKRLLSHRWAAQTHSTLGSRPLHILPHSQTRIAEPGARRLGPRLADRDYTAAC